MPRTSLASAILQIMKTLQDGESCTLSKLCEKTKWNFRTVQKALRIIEACQTQLESKKISIVRSDHSVYIQMRTKSDMTSLPISMQKMLVRTVYYPTPDRNEEVFVHMLRNKATKSTHAMQIDPSRLLDELVEAEHVIKNKKRYHLSEMGTITAKGVVCLYPELIQ